MANLKELLEKHGAYDAPKAQEEDRESNPLKAALLKHGAYDADTQEEVVADPETDSNIFAEPGTLRKDDLKTGQNATEIRNYMIERFGPDFRYDGPVDDDAMVEKFFNHMRGFNTNLLSTAGEVRWVSNATDEQKQVADRAFKLYDNTGNVFTNDGFWGGVDGVRDYMWLQLKTLQTILVYLQVV